MYWIHRIQSLQIHENIYFILGIYLIEFSEALSRNFKDLDHHIFIPISNLLNPQQGNNTFRAFFILCPKFLLIALLLFASSIFYVFKLELCHNNNWLFHECLFCVFTLF